MNTIKSGVCGFCKSHKEIFEHLLLLEVQKTFYNPPMEKTAKRWRKNAPRNFEFTVKAWQLITHPPSSPTYRKLRKSLKNTHNYGMFQPTEEVFNAFDTVTTIATLLKADIIIFQTPASFQPTTQNKDNIESFFSSITDTFTYGWEVRGSWEPDIIKKICKEFNIIHVVDPFKESSQTDPVYFRLHGSPPGKKQYYYTYTDQNLQELYTMCGIATYILFNNITMFDDAKRFHNRTGQKE